MKLTAMAMSSLTSGPREFEPVQRMSDRSLSAAAVLGLLLALSPGWGCQQASRVTTGKDAAPRELSPVETTTTVEPSCCPVPSNTPLTDASQSPAETQGGSRVVYNIPNVVLLDQHGVHHRLPELLSNDTPTALNFVFTTCTTICPVMTMSFSGLQEALKDTQKPMRLISISLDPEYDSPRILQEYAQRYGAGPDWLFLTGSATDVDRVLNAFNALTGSKFNHKPFTLFRDAGDKAWVRVEGLLGVQALVNEHEKLMTHGG